ncbi:MAG TPA: Flp pilus assembly protein CpaB [Candidatus Limnocylindrales bacterium]|nr:Flp pilus assembly protein CpaB [Candidatus Limnocylindrales bacterium]
MRRYRPFILLGLAGVIAFSTSSMVYRWLRAQAFASQAVVESPIKTEEIAVASYNIPRGATITPEMLKTAALPTESLPEGCFKSAELQTLVGRVATMDVVQNEPLLQAKLAPVDGSGGVAAILDPNKRAMSVAVDDEVGVAGFVKPSDRVDLFATLETEDEDRGVVTKLVLANTLVLAIGTEMIRTGKDEEAKPVKVITLEVTPEEAEKLAYASTRGKFRLALRSPLTKDDILTSGATIDTLLNSYNEGPERGQGAKPGASVQLIKGKDVTLVAF